MAKFFYNGVLLPEIPSDVLAQYPYCWIRADNCLIVAGHSWFYSSGSMYITTSAENRRYKLSNETWVLDGTWTDTGGYGVNVDRLLWSNHDIPNGSATATDIYFYGSEPVPENQPEEPDEPEEPDVPSVQAPYEYTFDFLDENWKTLHPDNYSVADGGTPFYVANTFTHDGKNTLRSGVISDNGTSLTTISFTLVCEGSIEFNYAVSSEGNYDWLTIILDGTQIVRNSGTVDWTMFRQELGVGDHVLELKYTKDGSQSSGNDSGAIGYLTITGMTAPFAKKYLVKSDYVIYTITDGVLTALEVTELTSDAFQTHGFDVVPEWSILSELVNPEVLLWYGTEEEKSPKITATMTATPFPQTVFSPNYDMSDDTILGVECAYVTASSDVVFAISVDDGVTWYMWTGQAWGTLTDTMTGMTAETINAITTEQWAGLTPTGQFKVRMTLFDENSSFTSFVMDYIN